MAVVTGLSPDLGAALEGVGDDRTAVVGTGAHAVGRFLDLTQKEWEQTIAGIRDAFLAGQHAAWEGANRIVFVSSTAAVRPVHGATLTATAGAFFHTMAQVAAAELGSTGTTVNVVAPGFVGDERFVEATPAGRAPTPADVAGAVKALVSADAAFVTGAIVPVDGGFSITKSVGGSPFLRR